MVTTTSNGSNAVITYTDPFQYGFDILNKRLSDAMRANSNTGNFPPYNVIKKDDSNFVIELAVAGFTKDNISITEEAGTLTVEGSQEDDSKEYLHKGIATRKFKRVWSLAEHMYVSDADLANGILTISVIKEVPEEKKPKVIAIGSIKQKQIDNKSDYKNKWNSKNYESYGK